MFVIKNKYRIKFEKVGRIKLIGHLDLLTVMQRTMNRSGLPISYSKGFNPHQIMSFALPLPLAVESVSEYLDIELDEVIPEDEIKNRLNEVAPIGIKVLDVVHLKEDAKGGAALVRVADYEVKTYESADKISDRIAFLNEQNEVKVMKKTKRSFEETDIKDDIFDIYSKDDLIYMRISTGSQKNIKPDLVINYLFGDDCKYNIKRLEMYYDDNGTFKPLMEKNLTA